MEANIHSQKVQKAHFWKNSQTSPLLGRKLTRQNLKDKIGFDWKFAKLSKYIKQIVWKRDTKMAWYTQIAFLIFRKKQLWKIGNKIAIMLQSNIYFANNYLKQLAFRRNGLKCHIALLYWLNKFLKNLHPWPPELTEEKKYSKLFYLS